MLPGPFIMSAKLEMELPVSAVSSDLLAEMLVDGCSFVC